MGPFLGVLGFAPFSATFQSGFVLMGTMDSEKASLTNAQQVKVVDACHTIRQGASPCWRRSKGPWLQGQKRI